MKSGITGDQRRVRRLCMVAYCGHLWSEPQSDEGRTLMHKTTPKCEARTHKHGVLRHAPLALILLVAVIGAFTMRDYLSFETLREHRETLLALRDTHFVAMLAGFILIYFTIVTFSLPGAAVASVTGGFLFGMGWGVAANVMAASLGAMVIFQAARLGLGKSLAAKMDASDGTLHRIERGLNENEVSV